MKVIDPSNIENIYEVHLPQATFYFQITGPGEGGELWPATFLVTSGKYKPLSMHVPDYTLREYERIGHVRIMDDPSEIAKFMLSEKQQGAKEALQAW